MTFAQNRLMALKVLIFVPVFGIFALESGKIVLNTNKIKALKVKEEASAFAQPKSSGALPQTASGEIHPDYMDVTLRESSDTYRRTVDALHTRKVPLPEFSKMAVLVGRHDQYEISNALSIPIIFSPLKSKFGVAPYQRISGERKEIAVLTS